MGRSVSQLARLPVPTATTAAATTTTTTTTTTAATADDDDDDNAAPLLPVEAQLHPDVVWVPATVWDIGHMTL